MELSVVSPVYRAEQIIPELISGIVNAVNSLGVDYEIILVEDGSTDKSWLGIEQAARINPKVKGVKLSRNFGQHAAITAGISYSSGDYVVVMDCDLQDSPAEIPRLFYKVKGGKDYVLAQRLERKHSLFQRLSSRTFYSVFSYLTGTKQDSSVGNFGIYSRKVIDAVLKMNDQFKYFPAQVQWVGFDGVVMPVTHYARHSGRSTYSLRRLISLALNNMLSFSDKPLRLAVAYGVIVSLLSFTLGCVYITLSFMGLILVSGFVSVIASIFFTSGSIIIVAGMVGLYVGKTFEVAKNRPIYIVDQITS